MTLEYLEKLYIIHLLGSLAAGMVKFQTLGWIYTHCRKASLHSFSSSPSSFFSFPHSSFLPHSSFCFLVFLDIPFIPFPQSTLNLHRCFLPESRLSLPRSPSQSCRCNNTFCVWGYSIGKDVFAVETYASCVMMQQFNKMLELKE